MIPGITAGQSVSGGGDHGDPHFANVHLLLHFDGPNNSTTFTDTSSFGHTVLIGGGTPKLSTAQAKFGSASLLGSGHPSKIYTTLSTPAAFSVWTLECFLRKPVADKVSHGIIYQPNGEGSLRLVMNVATYVSIDRDGIQRVQGPEMPINEWVHVAMVVKPNGSRRDATLFVGGVAQGTYNVTETQGSISAGAVIDIGKVSSAGFTGLQCYMDEYRLTLGVARYTSNFAPPIAPFPDF